VTDELPVSASEFASTGAKVPGSWWPDWDAWLSERSGSLKPAPKRLGNRDYKAQAKAPGSYVLAN
jgi:polyhydroxyalkanoate synthase